MGPLRRHTTARIGLARTGASLATVPVLAARMAHAQARDAVHASLDRAQLANTLSGLDVPIIQVNAAAPDRQTYLLKPDLGRSVDKPSADILDDTFHDQLNRPDLVVVVTDGLSARAAQDHAAPVLEILFNVLRSQGWHLGPVVLARHGRVAIAAHAHTGTFRCHPQR
jgi:ethanolamine ammonia-lyase small subunit